MTSGQVGESQSGTLSYSLATRYGKFEKNWLVRALK